jgi:hypothetical protein
MHSEAPAPRPAEFPLQVAKRNGLLADGKLGDWDKAQPLPSQLLKLPEGLLPFGEFWLAWDQDNLWIAARAYDLFTAGSKKPEADKEESWGELQRLELSAEAGQAKAAFYGATGYSAEEKAAFFCRPPAKGHFQAAAGTFVDKWHACWELAIPASELGLESLKAGQRLALSLKLQNRGDFEEMELPRFEFVLK